MSLGNMRWPIVIGSLALTLALLFGGNVLLESRTLDRPLKAAYAKAPAVESYSVVQLEGTWEIRVRLKDVPDLASAFVELDQQTSRILGKRPYTLTVEDRRTPEMEQAWQRTNLFVQEALTTGQFASMADRMEQEVDRRGYTARLTVDTERVYVAIRGNDGYLYSVVPRQAEKPAQTVRGGMGL